MPKISYKFTIPQDSYEAFRDDISKIASGINFEEVEFNDEAKTALFKCNAYDLLRLFETELRAQEKDKNYPFFCCSPHKFPDCERFENVENIDFVTAQKRETEIYEGLKRRAVKSKIALSEDRMAEKLTEGKSLVIAEYHSDPYPKKKLMELLESLSSLEQKPVLVLERVSSSRDGALQKWLKDGSPDSEIPPSIKKYCDFIDGQNLGGIWPSATAAERKILENGHSDILSCAKQNGFDVVFMESEHSTFMIPDIFGSRHRNLVSSMQHIKEENLGRNFIVFCGAYHDERSEDAEVILSDVVDAFSCELFPRDLPDKLRETEQFYRDDGKIQVAELYKKLSEHYDKKMPPTGLARSASKKIKRGAEVVWTEGSR